MKMFYFLSLISYNLEIKVYVQFNTINTWVPACFTYPPCSHPSVFTPGHLPQTNLVNWLKMGTF